MEIIENIIPIVAMTKKSNAIGIDGDMIYHLKTDLKYYKDTTMGHTIVCGRKTYFSFPKRPLPGRTNVVLTRSGDTFEGAITLNSVEEVIDYAKSRPDEKIFICGGDNVYSQFMDVAGKLYVTEIDEDEKVKADSFFPNIDMNIWEKESESEYFQDPGAPRFKFCIYKRK